MKKHREKIIDETIYLGEVPKKKKRDTRNLRKHKICKSCKVRRVSYYHHSLCDICHKEQRDCNYW